MLSILFLKTGRNSMSEKNSSPDRKYPTFYEKFIPIAIFILAVIVVGMLVFTLAIGVGAIQFS